MDNLKLIEKNDKREFRRIYSLHINSRNIFSEENGEDIDQISSSILTDSINKFINKNDSLNILSGIQLYKFIYNKDSINNNSIN